MRRLYCTSVDRYTISAVFLVDNHVCWEKETLEFRHFVAARHKSVCGLSACGSYTSICRRLLRKAIVSLGVPRHCVHTLTVDRSPSDVAAAVKGARLGRPVLPGSAGCLPPARWRPTEPSPSPTPWSVRASDVAARRLARPAAVAAVDWTTTTTWLQRDGMGKKIQCIGRYAMDGVTLGKGSFATVELATHGLVNAKVSFPHRPKSSSSSSSSSIASTVTNSESNVLISRKSFT